MSSTQIAKPLELLNPGLLDKRQGPYPTTEVACQMIPNTTKLVDGVQVNYRDGIIVLIGTPGNYKEYWWVGGFSDDDLAECSETPRILTNNIFRNSVKRAPYLTRFLRSLTLNGVAASETDIVHIYWIFRGYANGGPISHSFSIALNGVRVASWVDNGHTEPATVNGQIIETVRLTEIGGSGISGYATVNWAAISSGIFYNLYGDASVQKASEISPIIYNAKAAPVKSTDVSVGSSTLEKELSRLDASDVFKGSEIDPLLVNFLIDIDVKGLSLKDTDVLHVYWVWRQAPNPTILANSFAIGLNGVRIASWVGDNFTEVADASGAIISVIDLGPIAGSGITATAKVNWAAVAKGSKYEYFVDPAARLKGLLSRKKVIGRLPMSSREISRGSVPLDDDLNRMDTTSVFKGALINTKLLGFLLDISISGLVVNDTDIVHVFWVWRQVPNPTVIANSFSIGVNGVRVASWTVNNYIEPAADAKGNIIDTLTLGQVGTSGITATAKVNWAKIDTATKSEYSVDAATRSRALISPKKYNPTIGTDAKSIPVGTSNVGAFLDKIEDTTVFKGSETDPTLLSLVLGLEVFGIAINSTDVVHIHWAWRQAPNPTLLDNSFSIAINGTRVASWVAHGYAEPAADAKGNIFDVVELTPIGNSGVTAKARLNWAAIAKGTKLEYFGTDALRAKARIRKTNFLPSLSSSKMALPETATPHRIYTLLNDVDSRNVFTQAAVLRQDLARSYSLSLWVDRFLKGFPANTDVCFAESGTDKHRIYSQRNLDNDVDNFVHPTPSTTVAKTITIKGGTSYNDKAFTFNHISTRESVGGGMLVKMLKFGDSTVAGLQAEVGVPEGFGQRSWGVIHEQFQKVRVDYLLSQGYTPAQIQEGNISAADKLKFRYIGVGQVSGETSVDVYKLNYRGVQQSFTVKAEGRGGWNCGGYLNKCGQISREQGSWDALGLGNGSGTDYQGTADQMYLFDRTAWDSTKVIDTPAMRAFFKSRFGYTGSTLADYKAHALFRANNPENPFFDKDNTATRVDANGNTWQIRFSIEKYLSRYRTMNDQGERLAPGIAAVGSLVTDLTLSDVTLPSHIIMQSCQNDGNVSHFGHLVKVFGDAVVAEYAAKGYGVVNFGISIIDGAGTYFPKKYPEVGPYCLMNEFQRSVHNDNLSRALQTVTNEENARVFLLPHTFIIPTAQSVVYRNGNSPEYDLTGDYRDRYYIPARTSYGIPAHINAVGNRPIGIHEYAWIKYTLGL